MGSLKDKLIAAGVASERAREPSAADRHEAEQAARREREEEAAAALHGANARRYPGARIVTLAGARELLAPHAAALRTLAGDITGMFDIQTLSLPSVQVIDGNLELHELRMHPEGSNLYVLGDLTIARRLIQPFRANALVVFGSLRAHHVITAAELLCLGDLEVPGVVYGNCTDYATNVLGRARIGTLVSVKQHLFALWGARELGALASVGQAPNFEIYRPLAREADGKLDPAISERYDEAVIAAALEHRETILASVT